MCEVLDVCGFCHLQMTAHACMFHDGFGIFFLWMNHAYTRIEEGTCFMSLKFSWQVLPFLDCA